MSADVCVEASFVKLRNSRKLRTLLQLLIAGWKQLLCSFFPALFPSPILDSSWKKMLNIFSCKNEISFSSIIQIFYVSFSNVSLISCHLYRFSWHLDPVGIYLFKAVMEKQNNREVCLKLTIKTPERRHWRRSGVFIVNFKQISRIVLVFPLLT